MASSMNAPERVVTKVDKRQASKGLSWAMIAGLAGAIAATAYTGITRLSAQSLDSTDYAARTERILTTTPLIDGHNDLPYLLRLELQNKIQNKDIFKFSDGLASHTDLKRMKQGQVGAQFWSVFVECPEIKNFDDASHSVRDTLEQIDVARRFISEIDDFQFCDNSACVDSAFRSGRIASMLGAEGLHQTGSSIAVIRQLYDLGVRYITITHNCDNPYATAASTVTETGIDGGLTEFGAAGIREMNRLGMMVDLAHTSHQTMRQVLDITESPVIFSHSTCYALAKTYRNTPDDVLARLKENAGVIMIMFVKRFLNAENPDSADLERVVDHIFHAAEVAGWDHVGIGGDFDGTVTLANGINSVADYPLLIQAVMRRGATDNQIRKLAGENLMRYASIQSHGLHIFIVNIDNLSRVWKENERTATRLSRLIQPVEDVWVGRRFLRWNNPLPFMIPSNPNRIPAADYP